VVCADCFMDCTSHTAKIDWANPITYYGCRHCHQSQHVVERGAGVVAVLDEAMTKPVTSAEGHLRVNWLQHRRLFDFDAIEIGQASDENVERFAVQIGNDTDPARRSRYQTMRCYLAPPIRLSDNTRRILQRTFGEVQAEAVELPSQNQADQRRYDDADEEDMVEDRRQET